MSVDAISQVKKAEEEASLIVEKAKKNAKKSC